MAFPQLDKDFNHEEIETKCKNTWDQTGIYKYEPNSDKETFSIDTPPPYVSAAHLHVGHAMSYSQAEFVVRYQRMLGKNIYYPMGFDDNGLPTERYVENTYKINKKKTTRKEFRQLCLDETAKGAKVYKELWKSLGLSVDWDQTYSTIDPHCQKTSQESFIDLYEKGLIYRSDEPVLWDTHFETALAQADLDNMSRKGKLYDIQFSAKDNSPLIISTTRPELIPACVALYCHPNDERYTKLIDNNVKAVVPIFNHEVPIKTSEEVDMEFGTGLMMVCTFGDSEDVRKWKEDKLETRLVITRDGRMNELAGKYEGTPLVEARSHIIKDLKELELVLDTKTVNQNVSVAERSGTPVEFMMAPHWFIDVMGMREKIRTRAEELNWHPEHMKVRLEDWINGLKFNWNITRQRFYGVPFPVWYKEDGTPVIAPRENLPVDPAEEQYPGKDCDANTLTGDSDVMDTWMTSSLTPLINANWANSNGRDGNMNDIYPMDLRVQAFEIIRTWLFYTMIKSDAHTDSLPWKSTMISGWGLNEQGKKISKRDLEKFTDANGYNRYNPESVMETYGADALRYWAAGSHLGQDLRYNEKDVKAGRKLVVKLWNAARFVLMQLDGDFKFDPSAPAVPFEKRTHEDKWLLAQLNQVTARVTQGFEKYDYAQGRESIEKFFWMTFCDNYLEIVKDRFWNPDRYTDEERASAQCTLWESLRTLLGLLAPFVPFVTEELWQQIYKDHETGESIHVSSWPKQNETWNVKVEEMDLVLAVLRGVRQLRTQNKISQGQQLKSVTIDVSSSDELKTQMQGMINSLQAVARAEEIRFDAANTPCEGVDIKIDIEAA